MTYEQLKKAYEEAVKSNDDLVKKCSELENKNTDIENKNTKLEKEVDTLKKTIEDKDLEINHLTEQILKRNKMLFGQKSERSKYLIDGQIALDGEVVVNEAEELCDEEVEEPTEEIIAKPKKKHPHRGRTLHKDLEHKKVVFELPENQCTCPECQNKLKKLAAEHITSRLAIIPGKVYMVDYERMTYMCPHCDKNGAMSTIVTAPNNTPRAVVPKGLADQSLVADIMQRKYQLGIPLYRQEKYWEAQGIYLNRTSMANWVIAGAKWLMPLINRFWVLAFLEDVLNADETELKVLKAKDNNEPQKCWMWICATGACASKKISIYHFCKNRTKANAEELFGEYTGILQTDGMASYGSGKYINAGCWAHARRKFADSIPKGNKKCKAAHAVLLIDKAFKLEKEAKKENFNDKQILEMREKQIKPVIDEFYEFINSLNIGGSSHLSEAVRYAQNQKKELLVFLDHPQVEMTNNLAERTVKPFVIDRKNFLFSDTVKGADASAAVMSIIETAKRNGLDVYGYLYYLLCRLPEIGEKPTDEILDTLMPWSISLPPYCKAAYNEIL